MKSHLSTVQLNTHELNRIVPNEHKVSGLSISIKDLSSERPRKPSDFL